MQRRRRRHRQRHPEHPRREPNPAPCGADHRPPAGRRPCGSDFVFHPTAAPPLAGRMLAQQAVNGVCQPGAIELEPVAGAVDGLDFSAALFGDCTGNWTAIAGVAPQRRGGAAAGRAHSPRRRALAAGAGDNGGAAAVRRRARSWRRDRCARCVRSVGRATRWCASAPAAGASPSPAAARSALPAEAQRRGGVAGDRRRAGGRRGGDRRVSRARIAVHHGLAPVPRAGASRYVPPGGTR